MVLLTACSNDASKDDANTNDAGADGTSTDGGGTRPGDDEDSGSTSDDAAVPDDAGAQDDAATGPTSRDVRKWPFASDSIWNMPVGDQAQYVNAKIAVNPNDDEWTPMPGIDPERIVLHPEAPALKVEYSDAAWSGKDRCKPSGSPPAWANIPITVRVPASYVVPNSGHNNGSVFLEPDGHTLVEMQPFTRCTANGTATALLAFKKYPIDLYGDGTYGSHGGSQLSALGGTLRVGELVDEAPRHALKFTIDAPNILARCSEDGPACRNAVNDKCCFRWPAFVSDSGATSSYGRKSKEGSVPTEMKMGSLLAIPSGTSIDALGLESEPGKLLAWTLQNYGGYVVDATSTGVYFAAEHGADGNFDEGFTKKWGYSFEGRLRDGTRSGKNDAWVRDVQRVVEALHVVANNGPSSIGGGGTPRQPLAPALTAGPP